MIRLFVYGTLRCGFLNRYARLLARRATYLGPAHVRGRIYLLGRFPALRRSIRPGDRVTGEVFLVRDLNVMDRLDRYEGRHFARVAAMARMEGGGRVPVYVYEWRGPLPEALRIDSGDFLRL